MSILCVILIDLKQKFPMNIEKSKMNGEKKVQYEAELLNYSWASLVVKTVKNLPAIQKIWV